MKGKLKMLYLLLKPVSSLSYFSTFLDTVVLPDYSFEFLTRFPFFSFFPWETTKDLVEAGFFFVLGFLSRLNRNFRPSAPRILAVVVMQIGGGVILLCSNMFEGNEYLVRLKLVLLYCDSVWGASEHVLVIDGAFNAVFVLNCKMDDNRVGASFY